jgi:hypothetical protein
MMVTNNTKPVKCRFAVNSIVPDLYNINDFLKVYNTKTGVFRDIVVKGEKLKVNEKFCIFV